MYSEIVRDVPANSVRKAVRGRVDVGYDKHLRINKSKHFASKGIHINGIETFWSFTKRRLAKFNGIKANSHLHLKESEWRWNESTDTPITELTKMIRSLSRLLG